MISKDKRLNLSKNFQWVRAGSRQDLANLRLFYRFGDNTKARVGVATSSKQFRMAHDRIKAKRICFGALAQIYNLLHANVNLVIIPKQGVLSLSGEHLAKEIKNVKDLFTDD